MIDFLFYYLVFPGFLFLFVAGIFVSWLDRKITARLQWRVGPVFLQPYFDLRKLVFKEIVLPDKGNIWVFILAPLIALFSIILISNILVITWVNPYGGFIGDIIVLIYLLAIPSLASILGASASENVFASLGASREIKSILGYELPFILIILIPIIKTKSVSLGNIILAQQQSGSFTYTISGFLALLIGIICIQAKIGMVPFDMAEAETEIAAGCQMEYSGVLLAIWKLSKMMITVLAPLFLIALFWGGGYWFFIPLKYLFLLLIFIIIKNTNPRLRIDQSVKFFWGTLSLLAVLAVILAVMGY